MNESEKDCTKLGAFVTHLTGIFYLAKQQFSVFG